jgi:hypothetical protein
MPSFPAGAHIKGGAATAPINRRLASEFYADILPIATALHKQGLSLRAVARALDARGIRPRRGAKWSAVAVARCLSRAAAADDPGAVQATPDAPDASVGVPGACAAVADVGFADSTADCLSPEPTPPAVTPAETPTPAPFTGQVVKPAPFQGSDVSAAEDLLRRCRDAGVAVLVDDDGELSYELRPGADPAAVRPLVDEIALHQPELVRLLVDKLSP